MPKPLSADLRKRIIDAKLRGDIEDKIASEKEVSKSTVTKHWSLFRSTNSYAPRSTIRGRKPRLSDYQLEQIRQKILVQSDITLRELIDELSLPVCVSALSRTLRFKLGFKLKKKHYIQLSNNVKMSSKNVIYGNQNNLK